MPPNTNELSGWEWVTYAGQSLRAKVWRLENSHTKPSTTNWSLRTSLPTYVPPHRHPSLLTPYHKPVSLSCKSTAAPRMKLLLSSHEAYYEGSRIAYNIYIYIYMQSLPPLLLHCTTPMDGNYENTNVPHSSFGSMASPFATPHQPVPLFEFSEFLDFDDWAEEEPPPQISGGHYPLNLPHHAVPHQGYQGGPSNGKHGNNLTLSFCQTYYCIYRTNHLRTHPRPFDDMIGATRWWHGEEGSQRKVRLQNKIWYWNTRWWLQMEEIRQEDGEEQPKSEVIRCDTVPTMVLHIHTCSSS